MKKSKYVVINEYGAKIYINPEDPKALEAQGTVFLNPYLKYVEGVPPEHWKVEEGKIVPMKKIEVELLTKRVKDDTWYNGFSVTKKLMQAINERLDLGTERMMKWFHCEFGEFKTNTALRHRGFEGCLNKKLSSFDLRIQIDKDIASKRHLRYKKYFIWCNVVYILLFIGLAYLHGGILWGK